MDFKIVFTEKAVHDLDEIIGYISSVLNNPQAAEMLFHEIADVTEKIKIFPDCGSPVYNPYIRIEGVRKIPIKKYILFYYPDHSLKNVVILRIIYGYRNIGEVFNDSFPTNDDLSGKTDYSAEN